MNFSLDFVTPSGCATPSDFELIQKAFDFAQTAHQGQQRKSGKPYFFHLYAIAKVTWEKYHDPVLTAAALLQNTVADCDTTIGDRNIVDEYYTIRENKTSVKRADIYTTFGQEVGFLVDAVNKNDFDFYNQKETFTHKTVRLLWAVQQDIRAGLLKLADREYHLHMIKSLPSSKQIRISFETQAIYEPLKRILSYDNPVSLPETSAKLTAFTESHQLSTPLALKEYCFKQIFEAIDKDRYPVVYENTHNVVWKVEGVETYESLAYSEIFQERIKFILLTASSEDDVEAFFTFKTKAEIEKDALEINPLRS